MLKRLMVTLVCIGFFGCRQTADKSVTPPPADAHVRALADTYLAALLERLSERAVSPGERGVLMHGLREIIAPTIGLGRAGSIPR